MSRFFVFVRFTTKEAAERVLDESGRLQLDGKYLRIERAVRQKPYPKQSHQSHAWSRPWDTLRRDINPDDASKVNKHSLFVGNLSPETTDEMLKKCFAPYGDVLMAHVIRDHYTGG